MYTLLLLVCIVAVVLSPLALDFLLTAREAQIERHAILGMKTGAKTPHGVADLSF